MHLDKHKNNIHGFLILDKPMGISSNAALQQVKRLFCAKKAGYIGTLDPIATGMLPICFGNATKLSQWLINTTKRYSVVAKLGQRTDTQDAYGRVIYSRPLRFNNSQLLNVLNSFSGQSVQIPPMYSAIKHNGCRLYKYARNGICIPRPERIINIHKILLVKYDNDELELDITCSKGTYIRTIIDDLGEKLLCGAHVKKLRRLQVSDYSITNMVTFNKLKEIESSSYNVLRQRKLNALLLPTDYLVLHYPEINLLSNSLFDLKKKRAIKITNNTYYGTVRITEGKDHTFIGMAEINSENLLLPKYLIN